MQKVKIWSNHLGFLLNNSETYSNSESFLPILCKTESSKHPERDFFEFELSETEHEIVLDFLTNLIGTDDNGEIDATGRVADELIDIFNIYSE